MLGNYLIGLREGLEAALVVVVLASYLVKTGRARLLPAVWTGVGLAVAISLAFGAALTFGPKGLTFEAQELIGGTLSIVAVALVTWMLLWMARSARTLSGELKHAVDERAQAGRAGLVGVAVLAVGREGLETALFLWAATRAASADGGSTSVPLVGALLGLATAVLGGVLVYRGAVRINLASFFAWTGALLVLVAAGVLAYAVHDLQEARVLPGLHDLAFDVSDVVAPGGLIATVLKGVLNISPAMTRLEVLAWVLYAVPVSLLFVRTMRRARTSPPPAHPAPAGPLPARPLPTSQHESRERRTPAPEGAL